MILSHLFPTAIKSGIPDKNPCGNGMRLKVVQSRDRVLTAEEISLLSDKLQDEERLIFDVF